MKRRLIGMMAVAMVLACMQSAFALQGERHIIVPTTQAEQGLEFTVTSTPERDDAIIVRMEIPQKGKLENLGGLQLELTYGRSTLLLSPLATTKQDGSTLASFQIARNMVDRCYINLFVEVDPRWSICYAVRLQSYIPDKK